MEHSPTYTVPVTDVTETDDLTIDELARRTGMTVRNIRAHQSRGLLPPPEVRARTGYYSREHVARLELIKDMQADGFNLEAIRRVLEASEGASAEMLHFRRAVMEPFGEEAPEIVSAEELVERLGPEADPKLARRAEKLGLIRPIGDGSFEVLSPRLFRAGGELAELGVPLEVTIHTAERMKRHAEGVARAFVELFLTSVWEPFEKAGRPPEEWPRVQEALERLRPLASDALLAVFEQAMTAAVEDAFGRETSKLRRR